jgi:hypothetical protein
MREEARVLGGEHRAQHGRADRVQIDPPPLDPHGAARDHRLERASHHEGRERRIEEAVDDHRGQRHQQEAGDETP